ncbi:MAG: alpha-L-fucosidase [Bacteroidetes bacterium]|nr:MAG: alpha-L-fucosidase [Bacteroidota bacterium]PIE88288.1 MAG: alpha-L-fucosidase [Bacteroidota bacterium]
MKAGLLLTTLTTLFLLVSPGKGWSQDLPQGKDQEKMQWFSDAKLGIFIHWGIYAVDGIAESWAFFNHYISHEDYMKQLQGFTAENYRPKEWAKLIKESGAKYAVVTSKHHDGVALWDTQAPHYSIKKDTPAQEDVLTPLVKALRKQHLKVGLYYSLIDWSYPDYPGFMRNEPRYTNDTARWNRFIQFNTKQLNEITTRYTPDLYWFDGDWEHSAEEWHAQEIRERILKHNPQAILNSRLQGYGDYATPEQGLPVTKPKDPYWELCLTMNDSWGFQHNDLNYKSANQIIRIFVDCIGMGGNLLLDIGPKADGTIPEEQVKILKELGRWTTKHKDAIYGTEAGIPLDHYYGRSTLSKDKTMLYLFVEGKPHGPIALKGIRNKIHRAYVVGNGTMLNFDIKGKLYWSDVPGICYIDLPEYTLDPQVTVIAVLLEGPIKLYREEGQEIQSN